MSSPAAVSSSGKTTPLYANHQAKGAKLVDFAGWQMPLQFGKILDEHHAVRQAAGLFDVAHMGIVSLDGSLEATQAFLETMVPQDIAKLVPGKAVYTQFLNSAGGVLDDIIVYRLPEGSGLLGSNQVSPFWIVCNAANTQADIAWLKTHASQNMPSENIQVRLREDLGLLALQGPRFAQVLEPFGLTTEKLPKRFFMAQATLNHVLLSQPVPIMLARTGYTGEDGVELFVENKTMPLLWEALLRVGEPLGLRPIGLAARDTLRLEAGLPLHGHEMDETVTPLEAGLGWSVKLHKTTPYIGQAALQQAVQASAQHAALSLRMTVCFTLSGPPIARAHDVILYNNQPIGHVTSGSLSPTLGVPIGMGLIQNLKGLGADILAPGSTIHIQVRHQVVQATVVPRPFYSAPKN